MSTFRRKTPPPAPQAPEAPMFPMRINKYLALRSFSTRRGADVLIAGGSVYLNGRKAVLGDKVNETDKVEVRRGKRGAPNYRYYAYYKPVGVITHSPERGEQDIMQASGLKGVFPIGRLDKDSHGLIILTDDGRVTDRLLSPDRDHEKEYRVTVQSPLRATFKEHMESGVKIDDYVTRPCTVELMGTKVFHITLTEGKKHQIRRMCEVLHNAVVDLFRIRIMNVHLGNLQPNDYRLLEGKELTNFLKNLGIVNPA